MMKRITDKPSVTKTERAYSIQKPYRFCCDKKAQDPKWHYDMRNPPFLSSLTDVNLDSGGPSVKFRVQDVVQQPHPTQRKILEDTDSFINDKAYLGYCRRCRGPLRWYLEDEVAFARELIAKRNQTSYRLSIKENLKIAKRKARERRNGIKKKNCGRV